MTEKQKEIIAAFTPEQKRAWNLALVSIQDKIKDRDNEGGHFDDIADREDIQD